MSMSMFPHTRTQRIVVGTCFSLQPLLFVLFPTPLKMELKASSQCHPVGPLCWLLERSPMSPSSMVTGIMESNVSISLYNKLFLFTDKPLLHTCTNCTYNLNVISNDWPNSPETLMYSARRRWLGLRPIASLQEFRYMWIIEN